MKPRFYILMTFSLLCLLAAFLLGAREIAQYNTIRAVFADGATIGGLPAGGLDAQTAGARLAQLYNHTPVELRVQGSPVQIDPAEAGLQLDLGLMFSEAATAYGDRPYWTGFWQYLNQHPPAAAHAPLACQVDEARLRALLEDEIAPRYSRPPSPPRAIPAETFFQPGRPGEILNLEAALPEIEAALCSPSQRVVEIGGSPVRPPPAEVAQLAPALETLAQVMDFDGLIELYYQDLASGQEIHFAMLDGQLVEPGFAFTAASTIKIPVMVSAYKNVDGPLPPELARRMAEMIDLSDNASTDAVMRLVLDGNIAPIQVTDDLRAMGFENTFLAGFFYVGAPLLDRFDTPANQREGFGTRPDVYNQTTAAEMGQLLAAIQHCADDGGGLLTQTLGCGARCFRALHLDGNGHGL
jgi:beta-lactamase class A